MRRGGPDNPVPAGATIISRRAALGLGLAATTATLVGCGPETPRRGTTPQVDLRPADQSQTTETIIGTEAVTQQVNLWRERIIDAYKRGNRYMTRNPIVTTDQGFIRTGLAVSTPEGSGKTGLYTVSVDTVPGTDTRTAEVHGVGFDYQVTTKDNPENPTTKITYTFTKQADGNWHALMDGKVYGDGSNIGMGTKFWGTTDQSDKSHLSLTQSALDAFINGSPPVTGIGTIMNQFVVS